MIEFQADCGHTIQTDDRNAGQIVKCVYCGREVEAPRPEEEERDLLFQEVDLNELAKDASGTAIAKAITIKGKQRKGRGAPSKEDVGPQKTSPHRRLFIMGYTVIALVVVIFVGQAVVNFVIQDDVPQAANKMMADVKPIPLENLPDRSDWVPPAPFSLNGLPPVEQGSDHTGVHSGEETVQPEVSETTNVNEDEEEKEEKQPATRRRPRNPWGPRGSRSTSEADVTGEDSQKQDPDGKQSEGRSPRNPWGKRRGRATTGGTEESKPEDLGAVVGEFGRRLRQGRAIDVNEWKEYLLGGRHHTVWQTAGIRGRVSFIELLDKETIEELINEIGNTMLSDPDLDVRLVLLEALASTESRRVIPYLDRRLAAIERDEDIDSDEANREKKALREAKNKLTNVGRGNGRNPWKR